MKYIDTNLLVRIITGDDQALAKKAIAEIERGAQNGFCIVDAVLVELCFILEFHSYAMTRNDIATAIEALITAPQIVVSDKTQSVLSLYRKHPKLDYADCLLFVLGGKNGVFTFDKELQKSLLE
jgi:predicted nucleic-acid-binding protein